jgi:hypothetical protein
MKKSHIALLLTILIGCLFLLPVCGRNSNQPNALETMSPGVYQENSDNNKYFYSISALDEYGPNPENVNYPTMEHLLYLYIFDAWGNGNPEHSLLIDIKYGKAYYTTTTDFLGGEYSFSNYTEVDLSQMDIETITGFSNVQGILDWEDDYHTDKGETQWLISLYFDDGSYFQSGGEYYPDEYKELENDIWPLISDKTGEELWWMRGRP